MHNVHSFNLFLVVHSISAYADGWALNWCAGAEQDQDADVQGFVAEHHGKDIYFII